MQKRQIIIVSITIVLVAATFFTRKQFDEHGASKKKKKTPKSYKIETKVITVKNTSYPAVVNLTGRVRSIDRIDLYAEVSGVLKDSKPRFKEGNFFKKGQVLIEIDNREMRWQLMAKKSQFINTITKLIPDLRVDYTADAQTWEDYLSMLDPEKSLPDLPEITNPKLKYFISGRNINDAYFEIKSQEIKLSKYTIRAPFNGIVKTSGITPGTLVRNGQSMGEFISTDAYELEAAISSHNLKYIAKGQKVELNSGATDQNWKGTIYRIGNVINESTQTVNIYIRIAGKNIKEGMYLNGLAEGKTIENAFAIPRLLLRPDDQINIVQDSSLKVITVDVLKINNDEVIIDGLKNGTQIIAKPLSKVIQGTPVIISQ